MLNLIFSLIIGASCGCIAGNIMKSNHGLLFNMIIGLIGGVVGGFIFNLFGFAISGILGSIISGIVGSCLLIFIARKIK